MGCFWCSSSNSEQLSSAKKPPTAANSEQTRSISSTSSAATDSDTETNQLYALNDPVFNTFIEQCPWFPNAAAKLKARKSLVQRKLRKGTVIYDMLSAQDKCDELYIVVTGNISLNGEDTYAEASSGDTIGGVSFFHNTFPYYTAIANTASLILVLSRSMYEIEQCSPWIKPIQSHIRQQSRNLIQSKLKHHSWFMNLSHHTIEKIARLFIVQVLRVGDTLVEEDGEFRGFYLLNSGKLIGTINSSTALDVVVYKVMEPLDSRIIGNLSRKAFVPSMATVTALHASTVLILEKKYFRKLARIAPEVIKLASREIHARLEARILFQKVFLTKKFTRESLETIVSSAKVMKFDRGETIISQGGKVSMLFVLAEGSVRIYSSGNPLMLQTKPGSFFGEEAVIGDSVSRYTAVAGPRGARLFGCTREDFLAAFQNMHELNSEIAIRVLGKQCPLTYILQNSESLQAFYSHCQKEFASENIDFNFAVEEIENMGKQRVSDDVLVALKYDMDSVIASRYAELLKKSKYIYERFIDPESEYSVNISAEMREEITTAIKNGEVSYHLFSKAKDSIFDLLEQDSYVRFQCKKEFKDLLQEAEMHKNRRTYNKWICEYFSNLEIK